jgi:hypothetical protein
MASIRELANCIGVTESDLSILGDFFGFSRATLPPDPTGADVVVSLKRQVDRLEGLHCHLNIIRIGSDRFSDSDKQEIDYSIFKMRNIFHEAGVGIGRILHWGVDSSDADGLEAPTTRGDLKQITQNWTVPNDGIDLFIPDNMSLFDSDGGITLGLSPIGGTCSNKDKTTGMSGSVAGLWGSLSDTDQTARTVSHELGHYLGLTHRNGRPTNLMCQSQNVADGGIRTATDLIERQVNDISNHCSITSGC